jgi:hypothetical protein
VTVTIHCTAAKEMTLSPVDWAIWNANKFTSVARWTRGDFNADGVVDGSDFGLWNSNKFTSSNALNFGISHEEQEEARTEG